MSEFYAMKKSKFIMIMFFLVCFSCQNKTSDDENKVCKVNDPLTDLPWLKAVINENEQTTQGERSLMRIYQCSYKDGTGFIVELCTSCSDSQSSLFNCEGIHLCDKEGIAGNIFTCKEFNIIDSSIKLIYETKNN